MPDLPTNSLYQSPRLTIGQKLTARGVSTSRPSQFSTLGKTSPTSRIPTGTPLGELPSQRFEPLSSDYISEQANLRDPNTGEPKPGLVRDRVPVPNGYTWPAANIPESGIRTIRDVGQYVLDKSQPSKIIKSGRGLSTLEKRALLQGRSSNLYQIDHIIPLWAGGSDTQPNYQALSNPEHARKTKAQSVPYTLLANGKIGEAQARILAMTWQDRDLTNIPEPDGFGAIPLQEAQKIKNRWDEQSTKPKPVTFKDFLKAIPDAGKAFGAKVDAATESLPALIQGAIKGAVSGVTFGWTKYDPALNNKGGVETIGNIIGNIGGALLPISALGNVFRFAGAGIRGIQVFKAIKAGKKTSAVLNAGSTVLNAGSTVAKGTANVTGSTLRIVGSKVPGLAKFLTKPTKTITAAASSYKKARIGVALTNLQHFVPAMVAYGQISESFEETQDRSHRLIEDIVYGGALGFAPPGLKGVASVAGGAFAFSLWMSPDDSETAVQDALINAGIMAAMHGIASPGLRKQIKVRQGEIINKALDPMSFTGLDTKNPIVQGAFSKAQTAMAGADISQPIQNISRKFSEIRLPNGKISSKQAAQGLKDAGYTSQEISDIVSSTRESRVNGVVDRGFHSAEDVIQNAKYLETKATPITQSPEQAIIDKELTRAAYNMFNEYLGDRVPAIAPNAPVPDMINFTAEQIGAMRVEARQKLMQSALSGQDLPTKPTADRSGRFKGATIVTPVEMSFDEMILRNRDIQTLGSFLISKTLPPELRDQFFMKEIASAYKAASEGTLLASKPKGLTSESSDSINKEYLKNSFVHLDNTPQSGEYPTGKMKLRGMAAKDLGTENMKTFETAMKEGRAAPMIHFWRRPEMAPVFKEQSNNPEIKWKNGENWTMEDPAASIQGFGYTWDKSGKMLDPLDLGWAPQPYGINGEGNQYAFNNQAGIKSGKFPAYDGLFDVYTLAAAMDKAGVDNMWVNISQNEKGNYAMGFQKDGFPFLEYSINDENWARAIADKSRKQLKELGTKPVQDVIDRLQVTKNTQEIKSAIHDVVTRQPRTASQMLDEEAATHFGQKNRPAFEATKDTYEKAFEALSQNTPEAMEAKLRDYFGAKFTPQELSSLFENRYSLTHKDFILKVINKASPGTIEVYKKTIAPLLNTSEFKTWKYGQKGKQASIFGESPILGGTKPQPIVLPMAKDARIWQPGQDTEGTTMPNNENMLAWIQQDTARINAQNNTIQPKVTPNATPTVLASEQVKQLRKQGFPDDIIDSIMKIPGATSRPVNAPRASESTQTGISSSQASNVPPGANLTPKRAQKGTDSAIPQKTETLPAIKTGEIETMPLAKAIVKNNPNKGPKTLRMNLNGKSAKERFTEISQEKGNLKELGLGDEDIALLRQSNATTKPLQEILKEKEALRQLGLTDEDIALLRQRGATRKPAPQPEEPVTLSPEQMNAVIYKEVEALAQEGFIQLEELKIPRDRNAYLRSLKSIIDKIEPKVKLPTDIEGKTSGLDNFKKSQIKTQAQGRLSAKAEELTDSAFALDLKNAESEAGPIGVAIIKANDARILGDQAKAWALLEDFTEAEIIAATEKMGMSVRQAEGKLTEGFEELGRERVETQVNAPKVPTEEGSSRPTMTDEGRKIEYDLLKKGYSKKQIALGEKEIEAIDSGLAKKDSDPYAYNRAITIQKGIERALESLNRSFNFDEKRFIPSPAPSIKSTTGKKLLGSMFPDVSLSKKKGIAPNYNLSSLFSSKDQAKAYLFAKGAGNTKAMKKAEQEIADLDALRTEERNIRRSKQGGSEVSNKEIEQGYDLEESNAGAYLQDNLKENVNYDPMAAGRSADIMNAEMELYPGLMTALERGTTPNAQQGVQDGLQYVLRFIREGNNYLNIIESNLQSKGPRLTLGLMKGKSAKSYHKMSAHEKKLYNEQNARLTSQTFNNIYRKFKNESKKTTKKKDGGGGPGPMDGSGGPGLIDETSGFGGNIPMGSPIIGPIARSTMQTDRNTILGPRNQALMNQFNPIARSQAQGIATSYVPHIKSEHTPLQPGSEPEGIYKPTGAGFKNFIQKHIGERSQGLADFIMEKTKPLQRLNKESISLTSEDPKVFIHEKLHGLFEKSPLGPRNQDLSMNPNGENFGIRFLNTWDDISHMDPDSPLPWIDEHIRRDYNLDPEDGLSLATERFAYLGEMVNEYGLDIIPKPLRAFYLSVFDFKPKIKRAPNRLNKKDGSGGPGFSNIVNAIRHPIQASGIGHSVAYAPGWEPNAPQQPSATPQSYNVRGMSITDKDITNAHPILLGEISNRTPEKQKFETQIIANVGINRAKARNKTLTEVLQAPAQFQGYAPKGMYVGKDKIVESQYQKMTRGAIDAPMQKKIDIIKLALDEVKSGKAKDITNGAQFYVHAVDGSIWLGQTLNEAKSNANKHEKSNGLRVSKWGTKVGLPR